jgi:hypothetical protein
MPPKDDAMTVSYDPLRPNRVILDARSAKVASSPQPEDQFFTVRGPFPLNGFLGLIPEPIGPGQDLEVAIFFSPEPEGRQVQTLTAFATELSPPSTPWQGDAPFLTSRVQFDQQNQVAVVEFTMDWGSPLPVAIMMTASTPALTPSPPFLGPFNVTDYVFCSTQPDEFAQPGINRLTIDLGPLGITPWTISASVTELSPPHTPWQGAAQFQTLGVQLNQPDRFATVTCELDWPAPLPVAVMMTIGYS